MTKTIIYVDGYNLYYSRLRGSAHKWLDIAALFRDRILRQQDPSAQVVRIKYFTSSVMASYARHGRASEEAQTQYLRALQAHEPLLDVIKGFHVFQPTRLPSYREGQAASKDDVSAVWMIEEKQTDVNIALEIYRDAKNGACDQIVVCSNDSDLEPALKLIKADMPMVKVGIVLPMKEGKGVNINRPNQRLVKHADWVRQYIKDDELSASQLPANVQTKKKPASKPNHW